MTPNPYRVAVCRVELLPRSETFIADQLSSYSRWSAKLFGKRTLAGLDISNLPIQILGLSKSNPLKKIYERVLRRFALPDLTAVRQMKRYLPALVHVHFATDAVELWPTLKKLRVPVVVTLHGYDITIYREYWEGALGGHAARSYPRRLLQMAQSPLVSFVAVSNAIKDRAVEFGIPVESISVRYIGIDLTRFEVHGPKVSTRGRRLLFVGRLVEKKGVAHLLRAFQLVLQDLPDAELIVIGDGPLRKSLESLADKIRPSVKFLGYKTQLEILEYLNTSRLFCLPSIRAENGDAEGLGLVLLEAQAAGVPAITSAHGGAAEAILNGVTGAAFAEGDIVELSRLIGSLLTDDARLEQMSASARSFVKEHFDIVACTAKLEDLYADTLLSVDQRRGQAQLRSDPT